MPGTDHQRSRSPLRAATHNPTPPLPPAVHGRQNLLCDALLEAPPQAASALVLMVAIFMYRYVWLRRLLASAAVWCIFKL